MFVLGGILLAGICWIGGLDTNIVIVAAVMGVALESIPRRFTIGETRGGSRWMSKAEAEKWLRDEGYEPQTRDEIRQAIREEKATHNKNAKSASFWCGSDTYIDADGVKRYDADDTPAPRW